MCVWDSHEFRLGCGYFGLYRIPSASRLGGSVEARPKRIIMQWLVIKTSLKKSWVWLKHNWKVPLLVVWSILIYVLSRKNAEALEEVIQTNKESHRKEVEALNRLHREELIKLRNLQAEYRDTISKLEEKFAEQNKKLSEKQIEDVKEIVLKSKGKPEEIIRKIENDFGIKFKD